MSRFAKQLFFGSIYLVILVLVGWWFYRLAVPAPSCTDGIQNQAEEGLDCGAVCGKSCPAPVQALTVSLTQVIAYASGSFDVLVRLDNANVRYGASRVPYTVVVNDASGAQLTKLVGITYVNPFEPRWLVLSLPATDGIPATGHVVIDPAQVEWASLTSDASNDVEFAIRAGSDQLITGSASTHYQATVQNKSSYDFDTVDVVVLLYDASGQVVGSASTVVRTLGAGAERGFVVDWPFAVAGAVRAQAMVTTNLFSNDNYLQAHGAQPQSQGF